MDGLLGAGGITPAKKYLAMSESFGMPTEVMSWGNTLGTAANLHLMCSSTGSNYFEQAVPCELTSNRAYLHTSFKQPAVACIELMKQF